MKATASAANDNMLNPEVEALRDTINYLEENADELSEFDFAEVHRIYKILQNMVEE